MKVISSWIFVVLLLTATSQCSLRGSGPPESGAWLVADDNGRTATLRVRYVRSGQRYQIWLEERFGSEPHSWAVRDSVTTPPIGAKNVIAAGYDCFRAGIADRGIVAIVPSDQREGGASVAWLIERSTLRFQPLDGRTVSCRERCDDDCSDPEREN